MFCLVSLAYVIGFVYCYEGFLGLLIKNVATLVKCCSFFSINFGYISDPLHDFSISSICLHEVEGWSTGAVFGACLGLAIKPPEHRLDVVLVSLLVTSDGFYTLH